MSKNLNYINGRMALTPLKSLSHYSFALLPLLFPIMDVYDLLFDPDMGESLFGRGVLFFTILSVVIAVIKWRELKFRYFKGQLTDKQFENAVYATANKLNWNITEIDKDHVVAEAHDLWKSRDPQLITIVRTKNSVAINSMMDSFLISIPDLFGVNRTNEFTFLTNLKRTKKEEDLNDVVIKELKDEEERIENDPEWSFKNVLKRIIAYIFSFAFFAFGVALWVYDGFSFMVIPLLILGSFYVILDIYVIVKKM